MKNTRLITGLILALTFVLLNNAQKQLSERIGTIAQKGTSMVNLAYHALDEEEYRPWTTRPAKHFPKVYVRCLPNRGKIMVAIPPKFPTRNSFIEG